MVWHGKFLMIVDGIASCLTLTVTLVIRLFSLFSCSYHKLMVVKYRSKWEKVTGSQTEICCRAETCMQAREGDGYGSVFRNTGRLAQRQSSLPGNMIQDVSPCYFRRDRKRQKDMSAKASGSTCPS